MPDLAHSKIGVQDNRPFNLPKCIHGRLQFRCVAATRASLLRILLSELLVEEVNHSSENDSRVGVQGDDGWILHSSELRTPDVVRFPKQSYGFGNGRNHRLTKTFHFLDQKSTSRLCIADDHWRGQAWRRLRTWISFLWRIYSLWQDIPIYKTELAHRPELRATA